MGTRDDSIVSIQKHMISHLQCIVYESLSDLVPLHSSQTDSNIILIVCYFSYPYAWKRKEKNRRVKYRERERENVERDLLFYCLYLYTIYVQGSHSITKI